MSQERVIVIGGGLAGLVATCELLEQKTPVVIIDKAQNLGGTASKATCGIAAPECAAQKEAGINDSVSSLTKDTKIAQMLKDASKDVDWYVNGVGLQDLVLRRTPGHATKRTLSTTKFFAGQPLCYSCVQILEKIAASNPDLLQIRTNAEVRTLMTTGGKVTGVTVVSDGKESAIGGPVIIATGGYAGDTSGSSVLASYLPDLANSPTACDSERNMGAGIVLAKSVGAHTMNMQDVTRFPLCVSLDGSQNSQRGVMSDIFCEAGAKLLNGTGKRFVDEMASSSERVAAMDKNQGPFWLVLGVDTSAVAEWFTDFYAKRNILKKMDVGALAAQIGVSPSTIQGEVGDGPYYVTKVGPALYSCGGGISTSWGAQNPAQVLKASGSPIPGLYAAGEASASPFGLDVWSTSGVPLLFCVYSGRKAGLAAATLMSNGSERPRRQALSSILVSEIGKFKDAAPDAAKPDKALEDLSKDELVAMVKELKAAGPPAAAAAPAGPPGITLDEVATHNKQEDCWVVINGQVIDVTKWIPHHPGGVQAIMAYAGQDATEEWNMIHKPGTVEKNMKHLTIKGAVGAPGGGGGGPAPAADTSGFADMAEVAKHNKQDDAWVVINGQVIKVTQFIPVHPGGVQAIMAYVGSDASDEWNTIHKPGTVDRMATTKDGPIILGPLKGGSGPVKPTGPVDDTPPPPDGDGGIPGMIGAVLFLIKAVIVMALKTVFFTGNFVFKFENNRNGTIRSAIMLLLFTIVHAGGNTFDFWIGGPVEMNGETYFFERQHIKGVGAGALEIYILLAGLLHVSVALKRSWDISMNYCLSTGKWNMLLSGLVVLTFLVKHLQDFRFYTGYQFTEIRAPKYFVNPLGVLSKEPHLWTMGDDPDTPLVRVKDVYTRECELFKQAPTMAFYVFSVLIFMCHMCWGWEKLVTADAMQIPKDHVTRVKYIGWAAAFGIGSMYMSLPIGTYLSKQVDIHHVP